MINADMRSYDYYLYGKLNAYGQPTLSKEVDGTIKMAIYLSTQRVQDTIRYEGAEYIGLTHGDINSNYVIQYGDERLKVLYVNPQGRYKQVFMARV